MTEFADRDRTAELDVKPLLSPDASCRDGRLAGGSLRLLSEAPVARLGSPPGRLAEVGRLEPGSESGTGASINRMEGSVGGTFFDGTSSASSMMTGGTLTTRRSPAGTWVRGFGIIPSPPFPCARPVAEVLDDEDEDGCSSAPSTRLSLYSVFLAPSVARPGPPGT